MDIEYPLITVMIPCYNQASEITKAINSVQRQSYPNLEILIIDDCSTDATELIIKKLDSDQRIRYVKNPKNLGRVANYRHAVYDLSKGDWLINLDGDDYWVSDNYLKQAMDLALSDSQIIMVFARQKYFNQLLNKIWQQPAPNLPSTNDGKLLFLSYPYIAEGIPHMTALYKKEIALKAQLFTNNIIYADTEAMIRLLPFGKIGFINELVGVWNDHGNNASYTPQIQKRLENHLLVNSSYEFFLNLNTFDLLTLKKWRERYLTRIIREACYFYLDNYDVKNCFAYLFKAKKEIRLFSVIKIIFNPRFLLRLFFFKAHLQIKKLKGSF